MRTYKDIIVENSNEKWDFKNDADDAIMGTLITTLGYKVDRDRLIKALQFDRQSYFDGYQDGYNDALKALTNCIDGLRKGDFQ